MENWDTFWRCPWAIRGTGVAPTKVDGVMRISCGKPYKDPKGRTEIAAPIHGRRTD
jgi:hypothetical protein